MTEPTLLQQARAYLTAAFVAPPTLDHGAQLARLRNALDLFLRDAEQRRAAMSGPAQVPGEQTAVPQEVREHGWQWRPVDGDTAFAPPFGTVRKCRCGCLVAGGPTACARCADKKGPAQVPEPKCKVCGLNEYGHCSAHASFLTQAEHHPWTPDQPKPTIPREPSVSADALDLDELQKLCDAATPGEWRISRRSYIENTDSELLADVGRADDAAFIAAARDALPKLIAQVRQLQFIEERCRDALVKLGAHPADAVYCLRNLFKLVDGNGGEHA